jgi:hypothetical protein
MRALSVQELLGVWERGAAQHPLARALTLLFTAGADDSWEALKQLSIGRRNARLLTLREWMFGSRLTALAICPSCDERLELDFDSTDIRAASENESPELSLTMEGYDLRFRVPNSQDLYSIADQDDAITARRALLERCLLSIDQTGEARDAASLPVPIVDAIAVRMAQADPQANVELALECPKCACQWQARFDIVPFFWSEINAWALRVLREVHVMASAYGWREADILALSPQRRQFYLDLIGAA